MNTQAASREMPSLNYGELMNRRDEPDYFEEYVRPMTTKEGVVALSLRTDGEITKVGAVEFDLDGIYESVTALSLVHDASRPKEFSGIFEGTCLITELDYPDRQQSVRKVETVRRIGEILHTVTWAPGTTDPLYPPIVLSSRRAEQQLGPDVKLRQLLEKDKLRLTRAAMIAADIALYSGKRHAC